MKILYFVNSYPKVSHSFIRREIHALEALGFHIVRCTIRQNPSEIVDELDESEAEQTLVLSQISIAAIVLRLLRRCLSAPGRAASALMRAVRLGRRSDRGVIKHLAYWVEACLLADLCKEHEIDHVHAHFGTNSAAIAMLAHEVGAAPYSVTVHGPEEFDKPEFLGLGEKIGRSVFTAAVSSYGRSQLMRWVPYSQWLKIKVVHCGVDAVFATGGTTPVPDTRELVCVGRLCEQKGQLLLLEAMTVLRRDGVDAKLVLVGDGPMRGDIEDYLDQHGLRGDVEITGWATADVVRHRIEHSRAMVLPSFNEGLPVVIMEAMALSRPVISTWVAGIPELVIPGQTGWLVPAGDVQALAKAMNAVIEMPVEKLSEMGEQARERVLIRHDPSTEAAKLAAYFRKAQADKMVRASSGSKTTRLGRAVPIRHSDIAS